MAKKKKTKKNLVIVESPAKAETIERYLGKDYTVVASVGHVKDLPKSRMGIDFENDYEPDYITVRGKGPVIQDLKRHAKKAENIYLASDPDREGEAIAWHIGKTLELDPEGENRIVFNEITKDAVKASFDNPRTIDKDLVDAQQARRVLDRIVGYEISPILWDKVKSGLSAGRVQSVALKMIIDRENEIRNFTPEEYWEIDGVFKKASDEFEASLREVDGEKADLKTEEDVNNVINRLDEDGDWTVQSVEKSKRRRNPRPPFTTSSLQQDAANRLNFRTRKTMSIAQQLYEGVKIGKGGKTGLITYMRTDSTRISDAMKSKTYDFINEEYGSNYSRNKPRKDKQSAGNQDAHEAIRPTDVTIVPKDIESYLSKDQYKLYNLIWSRFVASQMTPALFDTVRLDLEQNGIVFRANGSIQRFDGFLKVYKDQGKQNKDNILPELEKGELVQAVEIEPSQHFTQPPARFNEASLVKTLEEEGVGRPSTYSPTLETLRKRYYVTMNGKRFVPTELGEIVNDIVSKYFPNIVDIEFTAEMEEDLDKIEEGEKEWRKVIDNFYRPFHKDIEYAEENAEEIEIKDEPAGFDCDVCGNPMVIKLGRYGKFYGCSNFPDCRNVKPILKRIGVDCPKCEEGDVVERKTKKNRVFWGCSRYPDCDFSSWNKPIGRDCPKCDTYLVEKKKRGSTQVVCPNCDYEEEVQR